MAEQVVPTKFSPNDHFLRRIGLPGQIKKNGLIRWQAFKEKDATLSLTFQDVSLRKDAYLDEYRVYHSRAIGGNLPGIVWLSFEGLTVRVAPPLEPRHAPDLEADPVYGHLHCVVDSPTEKEHLQLLQKLVNDGDFGGVLRTYERLDAA